MSNQVNQSIECPQRVAFVNLNSGKVFFDCHPAEAREAIKVIEDVRAQGSIENREKEAEIKNFKAFVDSVLAMDLPQRQIELVGENGQLNPEFLSARFREVENHDVLVALIIVNAELYSYFRTVGQTIFDQATQKEVLEMGLFGHVWTADVVVRSKCQPNEIFFAGQESKTGIIHATRDLITFKPIPDEQKDILKKLQKMEEDSREIAELIRRSFGPKEGSLKTVDAKE